MHGTDDAFDFVRVVHFNAQTEEIAMTQNPNPTKTTDAPDSQQDKTQSVPQEVPAPNTKPAQQPAPEAGKEPATDKPADGANAPTNGDGATGNIKV